MTETTTTTTTTTVIPEVALRWLVLHATTSNVELAHLSNVCRSWRDVVTSVSLEQVTAKTLPLNSSLSLSLSSSGPLLLLPSMAAQLIRVNSLLMTSQSQHQHQHPELPNDTDNSNSNATTTTTTTAKETFCAAWFAPEGIQLLDLDAEQQSSYKEDKPSSDEEDEFDDDRNSSSRRRNPYGTSSQQRLHRHCRHAQAASPNNHHHHHHHHPNNTNTSNSDQNKANTNKHNKHRSKSPSMAVMMNYQQQQQQQQQQPNQQNPNQQRHRKHVVMAPPRLEQIPPSYPRAARGHHGNNKAKMMAVSFHDQGILVSHEWQGYRHAMQVLHPFGYAECFVKAVLQQAQLQFQIQQLQMQMQLQKQSPKDNINNSNDNNDSNNVMHDLTESIEEMNERVQGQNLKNALAEEALPNDDDDDTDNDNNHNTSITQTTIAVRGATIARPEGYCLCWEYPASIKQQAEQTQQPQQQVEWTRPSSDTNKDNTATVVENNINDNNDNDTNKNDKKNKKNDNTTNNSMVQSIKWQERQRKVRQWKEWRRQLQLTVLPQVLVRANPHAGAVMQFLNVDQKHAVRLLTPKFACGPIGEPVTILVVGIATEDGCFCSGLHHRFELGHLYPPTPLAELAEMSPICMATDPWDYTPPQPPPQQQQQQRQKHGDGHGDANDNNNNNNTAASGSNIPTQDQEQEQQSEQRPKTPLEEHLLSDDEDDSEDDSEDDYSEDSSSDLADYSPERRRRSHKKTGWLERCTCIFQDNSDPCRFGTSSAAASADNNSRNSRGDKKRSSHSQGDNDDDDDDDDNKEDSQTLRIDDDDDDEDDDDEDGRDRHEDDDKDAERILRGSRIPGIWHCYTAVFDGKKYSTLRVDGVEEILMCDDSSHQDNSKASNSRAADLNKDRSVSPDHKKTTTESQRNLRARQRGPRAMLDGLTIGSDHCFDMTLCFGQGSGGEGEGAIAEIAVFSGRLDTADLEVLEKQLMMKHGIPVPDLSRESLSQEDEWIRSAHALYCQIPPEAATAHVRRSNEEPPLSLEHKSVPLRVMAKHRSVAWHQFNPVTGEELRIKRIGSRSAGSSSDW